jgi:hypothetical protein
MVVSEGVMSSSLNYARRISGRMMIVELGLIKGDLPENPHAMSKRVIAAIALTFHAIDKKYTLN